MKLPKSFRPNKDLENKIRQLIIKPITKKQQKNQIYKPYYEFLKKEDEFKEKETAYTTAEELTGSINYTLPDIEEFSKTITKHNKYTGYFISVLINKIITNKDTIILETSQPIDCIGTRLKKGTLIIKEQVGNYTGMMMKGGNIIIEGKTGHSPGYKKTGGKIRCLKKI